MIVQIVIGLALWLCGLATGLALGRRRAYRNARRSVWPATALPTREHRVALPAARLPAATRRALRRLHRANRADLARVLRSHSS